MTAAGSSTTCLALRLTIAAVLGAALCPVPGLLLPGFPGYTWAVGFALASLFLTETRTRWTPLKRGVALGLIAPGIGAAAALMHIAFSNDGAAWLIVLIPFTPFVAFGVGPIIMTIPCGIAAAVAYHLILARVRIAKERRTPYTSTAIP